MEKLMPALPCLYREAVEEISEWTGLEKSSVEARLWKEALNRGMNAYEAAIKFNLDFHRFNDKMERFYRETDSFIFENTAEFLRAEKQEVLSWASERIADYLNRNRLEEKGEKANLLMFGDGVGVDTAYFYRSFEKRVHFYYFDVPGSKTFDFAKKRFDKYELEVRLLARQEEIPTGFFDLVISLEVLEHLPDPPNMIRAFSQFLKPFGIALIAESYDLLTPYFPTHLASNRKYAGTTPFMFLREHLVLTEYPKKDPLSFKPMAFVKKSEITLKDRAKIFSDKYVLLSWMKHLVLRLAKRILS